MKVFGLTMKIIFNKLKKYNINYEKQALFRAFQLILS